MKAADSLIIFPTMVREALSFQAKCSAGVKSSSYKRSNGKIQKLRSDGKRLTESQNKRIQRISKVTSSSGQWTKFGVGILDSFHLQLFCSVKMCMETNAILSLSTGVYIYIKLKFRHSRGIISN